jgi:hypothetical protein
MKPRKNATTERARFSLDQYVILAQRGDASARAKIREILEKHPELAENCSDLASIAQRSWLDLIAPNDPLLAESLPITFQRLKNDLAGPVNNALERVLAERIVTDLLQLHVLESRLAKAYNREPEQEARAAGQFDAAHRRLLASIKAIAMVRKLLPNQTRIPSVPSTRLNGSSPRCKKRASVCGNGSAGKNLKPVEQDGELVSSALDNGNNGHKPRLEMLSALSN